MTKKEKYIQRKSAYYQHLSAFTLPKIIFTLHSKPWVIGLIGLAVLFVLFLPKLPVQAQCVIPGPPTYYAEVAAGLCSGVKNVYDRNGQNLSVSFTAGGKYQLTDPSLDILHNTTVPGFEGFFTLAKEKLSSKYYFIIADDDFIHGGGAACYLTGACAGGVVTGGCDPGAGGDICRAFRDDFIPIVASQLIGGLAGLGSFSRISTDGNCGNITNMATSYTIVIATGPGGETIDFVFEDGTAFLSSKGWTFTNLGMGGGVANLALDFCVLASSCAHLACENANAILPCSCGTVTADAANPWCCAADDAVSNTKVACQVGACALPPDPCVYLSCEDENTSPLPCLCGTAIADAANPWCCAAFDAVHSAKADCCAAGCGDLDLDGKDSIACGGDDCDDDNACVKPGMLEAEGILVGAGCPHAAAGTPTCSDGVDNDCDGLTDRCHDPDCYCVGGIVPCGRHADDPTTAVLESSPCSFCHIFLIIKRVIDLLLVYVLIPLATLGFVIVGALFLSAVGNPEQVGKAKTALKIIGGGALLAFSAWILIELFISAAVPNASPWRSWSSLTCPVAPCDKDNLCEPTLTILGSDNEGEDAQNCPTDCKCNFNDICGDIPSEEIGIAGEPETCPDCAVCGNGTVDVGEYCDPSPLVIRGGVNPVGGCAIFGYSAGDLGCTDDCRIDLSGCAR